MQRSAVLEDIMTIIKPMRNDDAAAYVQAHRKELEDVTLHFSDLADMKCKAIGTAPILAFLDICKFEVTNHIWSIFTCLQTSTEDVEKKLDAILDANKTAAKNVKIDQDTLLSGISARHSYFIYKHFTIELTNVTFNAKYVDQNLIKMINHIIESYPTYISDKDLMLDKIHSQDELTVMTFNEMNRSLNILNTYVKSCDSLIYLINMLEKRQLVEPLAKYMDPAWPVKTCIVRHCFHLIENELQFDKACSFLNPDDKPALLKDWQTNKAAQIPPAAVTGLQHSGAFSANNAAIEKTDEQRDKKCLVM